MELKKHEIEFLEVYIRDDVDDLGFVIKEIFAHNIIYFKEKSLEHTMIGIKIDIPKCWFSTLEKDTWYKLDDLLNLKLISDEDFKG